MGRAFPDTHRCGGPAPTPSEERKEPEILPSRGREGESGHPILVQGDLNVPLIIREVGFFTDDKAENRWETRRNEIGVNEVISRKRRTQSSCAQSPHCRETRCCPLTAHLQTPGLLTSQLSVPKHKSSSQAVDLTHTGKIAVCLLPPLTSQSGCQLDHGLRSRPQPGSRVSSGPGHRTHPLPPEEHGVQGQSKGLKERERAVLSVTLRVVATVMGNDRPRDCKCHDAKTWELDKPGRGSQHRSAGARGPTGASVVGRVKAACQFLSGSPGAW